MAETGTKWQENLQPKFGIEITCFGELNEVADCQEEFSVSLRNYQ